MAPAGALQPGEDGINYARAGALGDLVDETTELAQQPRPEVGALRVEATGQRYSLADQVGQTSLALFERPVRGVAVADQPAQEGVTDQIADFVGGPRADVEDGGGRGQCDPQSAQAAVLLPRGLVGVDHPSLA